MNASMSEKKSVFKTKSQCTLCAITTDDFLELEDFSDSGFILCANCEAMSTSEEIYGGNIYFNYASPRKGVFDRCPSPRTGRNYKTLEESQSQEGERIIATERV